jgi:integrase
MEEIKIAPEPSYQTRRLESDFIYTAMAFFKENQQFKTLIMLGACTGMRPSEIYRLKVEDIHLENNSIVIRQSKTGIGRTVYFTPQCKREVVQYLKCFKNDKKTKHLFGEYKISRAFKGSPIRVKQLRKYFIQEWHRRRGSYPMGELLLGHSTKDNISLQHYLRFSEEEIRSEYDRIMG